MLGDRWDTADRLGVDRGREILGESWGPGRFQG